MLPQVPRLIDGQLEYLTRCVWHQGLGCCFQPRPWVGSLQATGKEVQGEPRANGTLVKNPILLFPYLDKCVLWGHVLLGLQSCCYGYWFSLWGGFYIVTLISYITTCRWHEFHASSFRSCQALPPVRRRRLAVLLWWPQCLKELPSCLIHLSYPLGSRGEGQDFYVPNSVEKQ